MWFGTGKSEAKFDAIKKEFNDAKEVMQNEATRHLNEAYAELAEERTNHQRKIEEIQNAYNKDKHDWADLHRMQSEIIANNTKSLGQELAKECSTSQRKIDEIQTSYNKERYDLYKKLVEVSVDKKNLRGELARERSINQQKISQILEAYNNDSRFWREMLRKKEEIVELNEKLLERERALTAEQNQIIEMNEKLLERERALTAEQNQLIKDQRGAVVQAGEMSGQFRRALDSPVESQDTKNRLEAEKEAHARTAKRLKELEGRFNELAEQEESRGPWGVPTAWRPRKVVPVEDDNGAEKPPLIRKGSRHKKEATTKKARG